MHNGTLLSCNFPESIFHMDARYEKKKDEVHQTCFIMHASIDSFMNEAFLQLQCIMS